MFTSAQFRSRALAMVGLPYVLGAEWPASIVAPARPRALDCSELVEGLYRENSTPIGDLAAAQYDKTVPVARGSERVGDLVFLRNNPARWNGIGHVAVITAKLSTGDHEIVEARGRAAGTVRTTLSYWRTRAYFAGVRRYPNFKLDGTLGVPLPPSIPDRLAEDGDAGPLTYDALQWSLGLVRTGLFTAGTRRGLQEWLGVTADGVIGPGSVKTLQRWLDVTPDGQLGPVTVRRWQQWLNVLITCAKNRPATRTTSDGIRMGFANLQGYDGRQNVQTQAETLATRVGASVYALCETDRARRRAVEAAHGRTWWCWAHPGGTVAAAADLAKWAPPTPAQLRHVSFGTSYGHGALCVPLARRSNGRKVDLISTHTRPKAVATVEDKRRDIKAAAGLARTTAAVLSGDFAMNPRAQLGELGWRAVSPDADSMDRDGVQRVDAALVRNYGVEARGSALVDPGPQSDHMWGRVSLTALPASQPSPL